MDYELLKRLKEMGFPLKKWTPDINEQVIFDDLSISLEPTLSELIEACGDKFFGLNRLDSQKWSCHFMEDENATGEPVYSTPEEAVANLYLTLIEKGKI